MTEQEIKQRLDETTNILERQQLLKLLWKLRRSDQAESAAEEPARRAKVLRARFDAPTTVRRQREAQHAAGEGQG